MHRQHHRAGRGDRRLHRRDDHGSRHRRRVGHQLRRHHRRRHRGSYRHRHRHRRGVRHRLERRDGCRGRQVADHRDAAGDQWRPPGAVACCLVRRHRDVERRDAVPPGEVVAGAEWPAPRAAPRRTGCFRHVACGPPASEPPVADLVSVRGSRSAPELLRRPPAVRQPVPAAAPAARVPAEQRAWGRRAWPPGPQLWLRALRPPRRCRRPSPVRACRRRMTHAVAARRVLPPSTMRI
jgi:hypothetical protein